MIVSLVAGTLHGQPTVTNGNWSQHFSTAQSLTGAVASCSQLRSFWSSRTPKGQVARVYPIPRAPIARQCGTPTLLNLFGCDVRRYARTMDALPDGLTFDPETRGWENICAWYRGQYAGCVHHRRAPHDGWWADACNVCLGAFATRDEGKQAIIAWFRGLEIEPWE